MKFRLPEESTRISLDQAWLGDDASLVLLHVQLTYACVVIMLRRYALTIAQPANELEAQ